MVPLRGFVVVYCILQIGILVAFGLGVQYNDATDADNDLKYYQPMLNVVVMILIGFGFLMTFLSRYGYSALSYTYLLACFTFQWACLGFALGRRSCCLDCSINEFSS